MPPPYTEVTEQIRRGQELTEACVIGRAVGGIRIPNMTFVGAYAQRPHTQEDMKMFLSDTWRGQCSSDYVASREVWGTVQ